MSYTNIKNKPVKEVVWFWEVSSATGSAWVPFWRRDSDRLEESLIASQGDFSSGNFSTVFVENTHYSVDLPSRIAYSNYHDDIKPRRVIRGTWFWRESSNKYIPFEELVAENIEIWFTSVLRNIEQISTLQTFKIELNLGEALGPGKGQYKIVCTKQAESDISKQNKVIPISRESSGMNVTAQAMDTTAIPVVSINPNPSMNMPTIHIQTNYGMIPQAEALPLMHTATGTNTATPVTATATAVPYIPVVEGVVTSTSAFPPLPPPAARGPPVDVNYFHGWSSSSPSVPNGLDNSSGGPSGMRTTGVVSTSSNPVSTAASRPQLQLHIMKTSDFMPTQLVVKKGFEYYEYPEEILCDSPVGHLALVVHGIGEAMWSSADNPLPSFRESISRLRLLCHQQKLAVLEAETNKKKGKGLDGSSRNGYNNDINRNEITRTEFLTIEWHTCVHADEFNLNKSISNVTIQTIPLMRRFANEVILDVLLYLTPAFQRRILDEVCRKLNQAYIAYCTNNPGFNGTCSVVGHSLGTIISFDLLMKQNAATGYRTDNIPIGVPISNPSMPSLSTGKMGTNEPTPSVAMPVSEVGKEFGLVNILPQSPAEDYSFQLVFNPVAFYALGSPIALFVAIRNNGVSIPPHYQLPTCPRVYNIFHPFDPVAYRIEPLIDESFKDKAPEIIANYETGGLTLKYQLQKNVEQFSKDISQGIQTVTNLFSASTWSSFANKLLVNSATNTPSNLSSSSQSNFEEMKQRGSDTDMPLPGVMLNGENRIDYALQETALVSTTAYVSALSCHVGYFEDKDVARFLAEMLN